VGLVGALQPAKRIDSDNMIASTAVAMRFAMRLAMRLAMRFFIFVPPLESIIWQLLSFIELFCYW
jgi:hypothetical protein